MTKDKLQNLSPQAIDILQKLQNAYKDYCSKNIFNPTILAHVKRIADYLDKGFDKRLDDLINAVSIAKLNLADNCVLPVRWTSIDILIKSDQNGHDLYPYLGFLSDEQIDTLRHLWEDIDSLLDHGFSILQITKIPRTIYGCASDWMHYITPEMSPEKIQHYSTVSDVCVAVFGPPVNFSDFVDFAEDTIGTSRESIDYLLCAMKSNLDYHMYLKYKDYPYSLAMHILDDIYNVDYAKNGNLVKLRTTIIKACLREIVKWVDVSNNAYEAKLESRNPSSYYSRPFAGYRCDYFRGVFDVAASVYPLLKDSELPKFQIYFDNDPFPNSKIFVQRDSDDPIFVDDDSTSFPMHLYNSYKEYRDSIHLILQEKSGIIRLDD